MANVKAVCSKKYTAVHDSGKRPITQIKWVVIHDEESDNAESAASYFEDPESEGSAHLCVDDTICYRTLENTDVAWGAASASRIGANVHGFHIECAGYAKWSAVIWKKHLLTLQRSAYKTALHVNYFKLPVVFVDVAALLRGQRGITTHNVITQASKITDPKNANRYTHTDPGPLWPRLLFMKYVRSYYDELNV